MNDKNKEIKIQVFGMGCAKCNKLYDLVKEVAEEIGCGCAVEKITDIKEMMKMNILSTPALAVGGKVLVAGKIPSKEEIKKLMDCRNDSSRA